MLHTASRVFAIICEGMAAIVRNIIVTILSCDNAAAAVGQQSIFIKK